MNKFTENMTEVGIFSIYFNESCNPKKNPQPQ
jgi:hypothetical protein